MKKAFIFLLVGSIYACSSNVSEQENLNSAYGTVSSASPEASLAGIDILKKGGNAIDAAVAISFTLGVTELAMSGLGGGSQVLFAPVGQAPISINGTTYSPASSPRDAVKSDLKYHTRSTIPSTVKVMDYIWKKYGSGKLSWAELLEPAIKYAEDGFAVGPFRHMVYKKYEKSLSESPHHTQFFLLKDGRIPGPGDTIQQLVLAGTLKRLAQFGADDFYQGEIAKEIAQDMAENEGWISFEDLQSFPNPQELKPLNINYRDHQVYSQPPPCGGWTTLLILNLLAESPADQLQYGTSERIMKLAEALALAHIDRRDSPVTDLKDYHQAVNEKLSQKHTNYLLNTSSNSTLSLKEKEGETTHFSVVDKEGNAVAITASINAYFGAKAASPKLGFLYNTYMDDFKLGEPDHPFAIRPLAMAYSSMSPTIVQKNGETKLIIGSPGSARIISSVAQLTQLWIDSELGIEKIVALPRFHTVRHKFYAEDMPAIPNEWVQLLRKKGFTIGYPTYDLTTGNLNAYFGGVHAIALENGIWVGAADPRRDGLVLSNGFPSDQSHD